MVGLVNVQIDLDCQGVQADHRAGGQSILFFDFFFLNVSLDLSQTDANQVPPLLLPSAFGPFGLISRSIILTPLRIYQEANYI